eukprot:2957657-Karenia_brevis.AAC.1
MSTARRRDRATEVAEAGHKHAEPAQGTKLTKRAAFCLSGLTQTACRTTFATVKKGSIDKVKKRFA